MKDFFSKLYDKGLLFHYIAWSLLTMVMFGLIFFLGTTLPTQRIIFMAIGVSLVVALMPTYMAYTWKKSEKFYDGLKPFKTKANELRSEGDLVVLKSDLVNYYTKNAFHFDMIEEANKIMTIINTRLDHEFPLDNKFKKIERVICSAVKFDFRGKKDVVVCGRRHGDCYDAIRALVQDIKEEEEPTRIQQGFVTSENRYVERKEAYEIADKAGQLLLGANPSPEMRLLTSEDLFGTEN